MKEKLYRTHDENGKIIPLTKYEVRVLSCEIAGIEPGDKVLEIGSGTGGITIEAARRCYPGKLTAIEKNSAAVALTGKNLKANDITNVNVIEGKAPDLLDGLGNYNKVLIGGSGGGITEILDSAIEHLLPEGKIVCNFITLENTEKALTFFKNRLKDTEIIQVQISRGTFIGDLTYFKPENPVYILSGVLP